MGMFFGNSGRIARAYGVGTYEEIEDVYSRSEDECVGQLRHWPSNEEEEENDE